MKRPGLTLGLTWHTFGRPTTHRPTTSRGRDATQTTTLAPPIDVAAVLAERRRRYHDRLLPSPESDALVTGYLESPEGQAETARAVALLSGRSD